MLNNRHKTIGCNGSTDLNPNGILCGAPEFLDFEMLLQSFEEALNLPSVFVEIGNLQCRQVEYVGQEGEFPSSFSS